MEIIFKNKDNTGLTYEQACGLVEKLVMNNNICTLPCEPIIFNKLAESELGVSVVLLFKRDIPFYWFDFTSCDFRIVKICDNIEYPINIGYYKRDNEMNITYDKPFLDNHEEQTRFNDTNSLLLYASLTYKR